MAFTLDRTRPGVWISAGLHGLLLLTAVFAISSEKMPDADEGIPVEIVTDNQISEMTKGETSAKQALPNAKPRADRVADAREIRDPGEAKRDTPSPPKRPAEVKVADEDTQAPDTPPPPTRLAQAQPEPASAPPPPSRPDTSKADQAKAEQAKAEQARADAARADAAAKAEVAKAEAAERLEEQKEAEAIENAKREKAAQAKAAAAAAKAAAARQEAAKAEAKAELDAKMKALADAQAKADKARAEAEQQKQIAEAKAEAKAEADAKAKAEADAKARKQVAMAKAKADAETKARKQAEAADKFSAGDIRQLLASKEPSQSSGATGHEVQKTASLGTVTGSAQRMNPSQRDQLVGLLSEQLHRCWQVPIAAQSADKPPVPSVRVKLNQDGSLAAEPVVMNSGDGLFRTVADSATRATRRCAPLKIPAQFAPYYQDWRDLVVNFDPREMG